MYKEFLPCIYLSTRRAANALTAYYDRAMSELDITTNQFSIMIHIRTAKEIKIVDLAKKLKLEKSTLTRTLAPLIEQEYIHSRRGENRKEIILKLTDKGQEKMSQAFPVWCELQKEVIDFLGGKKEAEEFVEKLLRIQMIKEIE